LRECLAAQGLSSLTEWMAAVDEARRVYMAKQRQLQEEQRARQRAEAERQRAEAERQRAEAMAWMAARRRQEQAAAGKWGV
jgi:hypothetical protein